MRIEPLGDSALLVRVMEEFDAEKSLDAILRATEALEAAAIPGVVEFVPAYTTIGVFFDPARIGTFFELRANIERALQKRAEAAEPRAAAPIDVPVCYDEQFAPDLEERYLPSELRRIHTWVSLP
jgi:inhibitor of KinA